MSKSGKQLTIIWVAVVVVLLLAWALQDVIVGGTNRTQRSATMEGKYTLENYPVDRTQAVDMDLLLKSGGLTFETPRPLIKAVNAPGETLTGYFGAEDDVTPSLYLQPGASSQVTAHEYFLVSSVNPLKGIK